MALVHLDQDLIPKHARKMVVIVMRGGIGNAILQDTAGLLKLESHRQDPGPIAQRAAYGIGKIVFAAYARLRSIIARPRVSPMNSNAQPA